MPDETKPTISTFDSNEPGDMAAAERWMREKGYPFILIEGCADGYRMFFPQMRVAFECDESLLDLLIATMQEAKQRRRQSIADREERERGG